MSREYRHIKIYEKEILELKNKGLTKREIGEKLGFTEKQVHNFITRNNANKRKLASGMKIKPKGRLARRTIVNKDRVVCRPFIKDGHVCMIKSMFFIPQF